MKRPVPPPPQGYKKAPAPPKIPPSAVQRPPQMQTVSPLEVFAEDSIPAPANVSVPESIDQKPKQVIAPSIPQSSQSIVEPVKSAVIAKREEQDSPKLQLGSSSLEDQLKLIMESRRKLQRSMIEDDDEDSSEPTESAQEIIPTQQPLFSKISPKTEHPKLQQIYEPVKITENHPIIEPIESSSQESQTKLQQPTQIEKNEDFMELKYQNNLKEQQLPPFEYIHPSKEPDRQQTFPIVEQDIQKQKQQLPRQNKENIPLKKSTEQTVQHPVPESVKHQPQATDIMHFSHTSSDNSYHHRDFYHETKSRLTCIRETYEKLKELSISSLSNLEKQQRHYIQRINEMKQLLVQKDTRIRSLVEGS